TTKVMPREFTNAIGMKFIWIQPGTFLMGSPLNEKGRGQDEKQFRVKITKGFYMGVYAVTQAQWKAVMGNNPSSYQPQGMNTDNYPVERVSWTNCQEFVEKMRAKDGK